MPNAFSRLLPFVATAIGLLLSGAADGRQPELQTDSLQDRLVREDLGELAADVRRLGHPERGALVFYQPELNCARCHDRESSGRRLGPDLAQRRAATVEQLIESILYPSRQIRDGYQTAKALTIDGRTLTGVLVGVTQTELIIDQIEQPDEPLRLPLSDIEEWRKTTTSSMPEALANQLADRQQFLDLVSYLAEIARQGPKRAEELRPSEAMLELPPLPEYESRVDHARLIQEWDQDSWKRGRDLYHLRCASCHGTVDREGTLPSSMRFAEQRFKRGRDPYSLYRTLTDGYGMMNAQRWMVPRQKYDVIHYLREHFLRERNPDEYFAVTPDYLATLPNGDTTGPEPEIDHPWTRMNYGTVLQNTIEISDDGSNIAQKGIAVRLDAGPGGVESGRYWLLYDHDTMRVAGAWQGRFIDYNGIHFNGVHGRHPRVAGQRLFASPPGPGWGRTSDSSFEDVRLTGRDGRRYGPLPRNWLHYRGRYQYGRRCILRYLVGETEILESPSLQFVGHRPAIVRQFHVAGGASDLLLRVARAPGPLRFRSEDGSTLAFGNGPGSDFTHSDVADKTLFDGRRFGQVENRDALKAIDGDFTLTAEIRTGQDGTIFCRTRPQESWCPDGITLFIEDGRLHYDIGWVGVVESDTHVADGAWHRIALSWRAQSGEARLYVDGEATGRGRIRPTGSLTNAVVRLGFTNRDFPATSPFSGRMRNVRLHSRCLSETELRDADGPDDAVVAHWLSFPDDMSVGHDVETEPLQWVPLATSPEPVSRHLVAHVTGPPQHGRWEMGRDGDICLRIAAATEPFSFSVKLLASEADPLAGGLLDRMANMTSSELDLSMLIRGGPPQWPELSARVDFGKEQGPFQVDAFQRPDDPDGDRLRLTGIDFLRGGRDAVVCCWDGTVWRVTGIADPSRPAPASVSWRRVATGLFQPLGVRVVDEQIYVCCRDQIVCLHDLNGDGETDWYRNFNSDHQVTEHFHEFAMGLQTDSRGNFYYAKSARHALPAVVPQHGTLIRVAADGTESEIVAVGFRAANGVCINGDGTFLVTDQEGHWNPKNRINWVRPGGFYGNMLGYHDIEDTSDAAMERPVCWITNHFDRSPGELLWITSSRWQPLQGRLLNLSYGNGRIFIVPHEQVNGTWQGGMCALPLKRFPTGIMRGRFNPLDGQLYCCGMYAWSGDQTQPGGLYRVRRSGRDVHLPVNIAARRGRLEIEFSGDLDPASVSNTENYRISTWDLKRTADYGSEHYNEKKLSAERASLKPDGRTVVLAVPRLAPTRGMEIKYSLRTDKGDAFRGTIHNTIHHLAE